MRCRACDSEIHTIEKSVGSVSFYEDLCAVCLKAVRDTNNPKVFNEDTIADLYYFKLDEEE